MCMHAPGLMKSERPKSVALRGESSFVDLNRKFYTPVRLLATHFNKKILAATLMTGFHLILSEYTSGFMSR